MGRVVSRPLVYYHGHSFSTIVTLDLSFFLPSLSLSLSRSPLTDSRGVERLQGTRPPLIRHWPPFPLSALLISSSSLILNCDVFTGSREIYRPRGEFSFDADTPNLKETSQLYARAYTSSSSSFLSLLFRPATFFPSFFFFLPPPRAAARKGTKTKRR